MKCCGDVSTHHLPDKAKRERLGTICDVCTLNADNVHMVCLGEFDDIIGVFDHFESGQGSVVFRTRHAFPSDRPRMHLVKGLEQNISIFQVLEQVEYTGLHVEAVEPQSEYARFTLALGIKLFDGWRVLQGLETGPRVEQVSDKGEI